MPVRVWRRRVGGWRKPPGSVMVNRPSRWGNPFRVGGRVCVFAATAEFGPWPWPYDGGLPDGDYGGFTIRGVADRADAVGLFEMFVDVYEAEHPGEIERQLGGKDLGCFCPPPEPCHVDVLLRAANPDK